MSVEGHARPAWRVWAGRGAWIALAAAIFFGVRFYQQRTLIEGPAPALQAALLDGTVFDLSAVRDRPVLVYFWATWCPVCRLEQGSVESLAEDHRVIAVAMQSGDSTEVTSYMRKHGLRVPVINDPLGAVAAARTVRGAGARAAAARRQSTRRRFLARTHACLQSSFNRGWAGHSIPP